MPLGHKLENCLERAESYRQDYIKSQQSLRRAHKMLREIYGMQGPRDGAGPLAPRKFAKMTRQQVDNAYDFPQRHRMHAVAKLLSK